MNLDDLLQESGDRHLTAAEREQLQACARQLELAARVAAAVEAAEPAVVEDVVETLRERFPRFAELQPQAWERLAADLQLVVRHDVRALIRGDPRSLDDSVLLYLRSILAAYRLSPGFVRECFTRLREALKAKLGREEASALDPYLKRNIDVLSDLPEPAAAVV